MCVRGTEKIRQKNPHTSINWPSFPSASCRKDRLRVRIISRSLAVGALRLDSCRPAAGILIME